MKVNVTGIGVISAIGVTVEENLESLRQGRSGIQFDPDRGLMLGAISFTNEQIRSHLQLTMEERSRTSLLSLWAAKEAWGGNLPNDQIRTGVISGTSVGGMDRNEIYYNMVADGNSSAYDRIIFENGGTTEFVADQLGIQGFVNTVSTACSSGINSIVQGYRMIQAGLLDRVLVGACDPLANFDVHGFSALGIYDTQRCRPFDENRAGLNLGEAAGFMVLENEKSLKLTGHKPLCQITGWGNSTDAYHQTASSPDGIGAQISMNEALSRSRLSPSDIDYVNAHGTGTPNNDLSESKALEAVFAGKIPSYGSTKGYTGHTLAAAGAIECVFSVLALTEQEVYPSINIVTPLNDISVAPITSYMRLAKMQHVLSNSFGFGGNCSSIIFSSNSYVH